MDHHADLASPQAHDVRRVLVANVVDVLDLEEVVSGPQAAELGRASLERALRELVGLGVGKDAAVLGELRIFVPAGPLGQRILDSLYENVLELASTQGHAALAADPARDLAAEDLYELAQPRL